MNNKEWEDKIRFDARLTQKIQECPYTAVRMRYVYNGHIFQGNGFSKCKPGDEWNSNDGFEIAVTRAIRSIRKQIQKYISKYALPLSA